MAGLKFSLRNPPFFDGLILLLILLVTRALKEKKRVKKIDIINVRPVAKEEGK